jgi:two-component system capsular synthesis sensor histidine kinase RcsC
MSSDDINFLRIQVRDTGVGMTSIEMTNLFNIFGKLESTKNINHNGTGLGLFISKQLA